MSSIDDRPRCHHGRDRRLGERHRRRLREARRSSDRRAALVVEPGAAAYAVAKAGVIKLTEVLAAALTASGVRVNVIIPAIIDTAVNRQALPEKLMQKAVAPAEIAAVIAYLCSDAALAITGAAIPVYGKY